MEELTVLIVSGHRPVADWLGDVTGKLGYVRVATSTQEEALRAVQILGVDLVILDSVGMADQDSAAMIDSLKSLSANCHLLFVRIAGLARRHASSGDGARPRRDLVDVGWPVTVCSLRRAIAEALCYRGSSPSSSVEPLESEADGRI